MRGARVPLVFSTEGPVCAACRRLAAACTCPRDDAETLPARPVIHLRVERKGRGGKTVTVLAGLPRNTELVRQLAAELKRACGSGGSVSGATVELQGDQRERVRALLTGRGWLVRG